MNIERLTEIAEWLEAGGDDGTRQFVMCVWIDDGVCGTACCIGGYTERKWPHPGVPPQAQAQMALGLTREQGYALFMAEDAEGHTLHDLDGITAEHAARVVRHLIATGKIDWAV